MIKMVIKRKIEAAVYSPKQRPQTRSGRGFSLIEIKEAKLTPHDAKRLKTVIDKRRKTTHPQNVQALKQQYESLILSAKAEKRRKKPRKTSGRKAK
jgi:large subunit ribosomal protein L13e